MSLLSKALIGGAVGGAMSGDWGGVAGGAATSTLGWGALSRYGKGLGAAGAIKKGLGYGIKYGMKGRRAANTQALGSALRGNMYGARAAGYASDAMSMGITGMAAGRKYLGGKSLATNKWAGRSMAAMGVGAGAYIGSTVLRSNRGY